jgi:signal transduction histidine kinase
LRLKFRDKTADVHINTLKIYRAAIPIAMGYTFLASIFSMNNLGLFNFSNTAILRDILTIDIMFFSFMAIFSVFIFIVFTNLNKVVKLKEEEIKTKNQKLLKIERLSAIGEVSARISHDMRNPISVLKNALHVLETRSKDEDITMSWKEFGMIQRAVTRMSHQVEDVLDFVREKPLDKKYVNLKDILNMAAYNIPKNKNVKITLPENQVMASCDDELIERVFNNLLLNAFQAIEKNGEIKIRISDSPSEVTIDFEDSGPGMSDEVLSNMMEPLFTTKQQGTGLGLTCCTKIIDQHNGWIDFKNNPTTFKVHLPKK